MVVLQDTREKPEHKQYLYNYFAKNNIKIVRQVLNVGDYMLPNGKTSIDLKGGGLNELASDLMADYFALNKKYRKCLEHDIHLVVLIEENFFKEIKDVVKWRGKYGKISGKRLAEKMHRIELCYGVEFVFCKKSQTAQKIIELLKKGESNEN